MRKFSVARRYAFLGLLALAGLLAAAAVAQDRPAREGGRRGPGMDPLGRMFSRLELTEEQKAKVRGVREAHADRLDDLRFDRRDAERTLRLSQSKPTVDAAAVKKASAALAEIELQASLERARMWSEIRALLTPEQIAKIEAGRERAREARAERAGRRAEGAAGREGEAVGACPRGERGEHPGAGRHGRGTGRGMERGERRGGPLGGLLMGIHPTEEQRTKIREAMEGSREKADALRRAETESRRSVRKATMAGAFDPEAVKAACQASAAAQEAMSLFRAEMFGRVYGMLDEQQKARLDKRIQRLR